MMMKKINNVLFYLLPLVFLTFCDKDPALDGNPSGDNLDKIDSIQFKAYTFPQEPLDALNEVNFPLGNLNDSRFGKSTASIYTQLLLSVTSFEPGNNASLDSAVLEIAINEKYGPMTLPVTFNVYEMTEAIDNNNTYTSESDITFDNTVIGTVNYTYSNGDNLLRIPINTTFAADLFSQLGTTVTQSNTNLLDYLNGIYLQPDELTGGDGHLNLDLTNAGSGLKLYFTSDNPSDSVYRFAMSTQALKVNKYSYDLSGSEVQAAFDDATNDDNELLIGGLGISKAKIEIPDLSFLQGAVVNQAKLTFAQTDYGSASNAGYDVPTFLLLYGEKENDTIQYFITDYSSNNPTSYGGLSGLQEINGVVTNAYSYRIPRFIQRVVDETTDIDYFVLQTVNYNSGNRVKLGGGSHPDFPIQLEILYTKP